MSRLVFTAFILAGVVGTVAPAFADPRAAATFDTTQAKTSSEQPLTPAPVSSAAGTVVTPNSGPGKDAIPFGSGWG
jgi:hypothetical protein